MDSASKICEAAPVCLYSGRGMSLAWEEYWWMKVLIGQQPWQEEVKDMKWECPYSWRGTPFRTDTNALCMSCYSVARLCPALCDPMDCSTPGLPVLYYLPEFAQNHVHWVGDAIHPSHPLLPPSPSAFNLSERQALFQWVGSSHQFRRDDFKNACGHLWHATLWDTDICSDRFTGSWGHLRSGIRAEPQGLGGEAHTTSVITLYVASAIKANETPKETPAEVEFTIINYKPPQERVCSNREIGISRTGNNRTNWKTFKNVFKIFIDHWMWIILLFCILKPIIILKRNQGGQSTV